MQKETYELRLKFRGDPITKQKTKALAISWLQDLGVSDFVEGVVDRIDIDYDYERSAEIYYENLGGDVAPISVFKYSQEFLKDLAGKVGADFGNKIKTEMNTIATDTWMNGWKENFHPMNTELFYIYAPWHKDPPPAGKVPIQIEPGMAFGTGQHATTRVCLMALENYWGRNRAGGVVADIGTGTGILSIAAAKLGATKIVATDVDEDAVTAAKENARINEVKFEVLHGSLPSKEETDASCDIVMANILTPVLRRLMEHFARLVKPGGVVILAGLLRSDEQELVELASSFGLRRLTAYYENDWTGLVLQKFNSPYEQ